jgi:hypothetical protein
MKIQRMSCVAALIALVLASSPVYAGTKLNVGELSADGLTVLDMTCELDQGGFLASAMVVGALAKQKKALDACGPQGAATRASFKWEGAKTSEISVLAASDDKAGKCVAKTLGKVKAAMGGQCTVTILSGPTDKAKAAAASLKAKETPKEEAKHPYLEPSAWTTLSNTKQGWQMWALKESKPIDISLKVGESLWEGAAVEHKQQLSWVLWHPSAKLDAPTIDKISAEMFRYSPEVTWIPVTVNAGDAGFTKITLHKAQHKEHVLLRIVGEGKTGSYVFIGLFSIQMPVEVLQLWLRSIKIGLTA